MGEIIETQEKNVTKGEKKQKKQTEKCKQKEKLFKNGIKYTDQIQNCINKLLNNKLN